MNITKSCENIILILAIFVIFISIIYLDILYELIGFIGVLAQIYILIAKYEAYKQKNTEYKNMEYRKI